MPQVAALSVLGHGLVCDGASQASISRRGRFLVESARGAPRGSGGPLGPPSTSAPPAPSSPTRPGNHIKPTDTNVSPTGGSATRPGDPHGSPRLPLNLGPLRARFARGDRPQAVLASYDGQCVDVWSGTRAGIFSDPAGIVQDVVQGLGPGTPLSRLSARLRPRPNLGCQLGGRRHGWHRARKLSTPRPTARSSPRRCLEPP